MSFIHYFFPLISSCAFFVLGILVFLLAKNKNKKYFLRFCYTTFHWQFAWFWQFYLNNENYADLIVRIGYSGIIFLPITFYESVCYYLNIKKNLIKYFYGLGFGFLFFLWTTNYFIKGYHKYYFGYYPEGSILHLVYMLMVTFIIFSMIFNLWKIYQKETNVLKVKEIQLFLIAVLIYCLAAIDYTFNYPFVINLLPIKLYPIGVTFIIVSLVIFILTHFIILNAHLTELNENLEFKVLERTKQLNESYEKLKNAEQVKKQLGKVLLHDIKQPLTNIDIYFTYMLKYFQTKENSEKLINKTLMANFSCRQTFNFINNMLEVEALEENRNKFFVCDTDILSIIENEIQYIKNAYPKVKFILDIKDLKNTIVQADAKHLKNTIMNLLNHAWTFSQNENEICIILANESKNILCKIINKNYLLKESNPNSIFRKDYSLLNQDSRLNFALSLSYSKLAIELMSGKIWAETNINENETIISFLLKTK